jgi:hypothetical protein
VFALGAAIALAVVGAALTFTGPGMAVIHAVYGFLEFYSGVFCLVSLSIAVMVGLAATDRIVLMVRHRVLLQAVHRATASTAMVFLAVHVITKIVEGHASVIDVVVPFLASHRVVYVGLGTIASYLMILVAWTGVIRGRFAGSAHPGLWRALHASAYLSWVFALFHGLESGRHAKTWVTVSYVVCVLLVVLALLVRVSVTWGRRMRSPKAQTTGTIKAVGKLVPPPEPAFATLLSTDATPSGSYRTLEADPMPSGSYRTLETDPTPSGSYRTLDADPMPSGSYRTLDDGAPPFARHTADEDDRAPVGRHTAEYHAVPSARHTHDDDARAPLERRAVRDDPAAGARYADRGDADRPLAVDEPGVEWYDEAGNRSFAAGPSFSGPAGPRRRRAAPDDTPVTGEPLAPLAYLDDTSGYRTVPDYQAPEEEPSFPEGAYHDTGPGPARSGTGAYRQVRDDRDGMDLDPGGWRRDTRDRERPVREEPARGAPTRGAPTSSAPTSGAQTGRTPAPDQPDDPARGYLDTRPQNEPPQRPMRRPRTPVDDLMVPGPVEEPPKRRRRRLAELPAGPSTTAESGKPPEDITDEEFWAHMRGDVLR